MLSRCYLSDRGLDTSSYVWNARSFMVIVLALSGDYYAEQVSILKLYVGYRRNRLCWVELILFDIVLVKAVFILLFIRYGFGDKVPFFPMITFIPL